MHYNMHAELFTTDCRIFCRIYHIQEVHIVKYLCRII